MNVSSEEFVLWLNGAAAVIGEAPPTAEQWAMIRETVGHAVGTLVSRRLVNESFKTKYTNPIFQADQPARR